MSHRSVLGAGSGQDKATTAPSSSKTTSVNRKLREALSPSPDASPRSPSPPYHRNRDRSRSPYRASRSPPGGWKRRRNEDSRENSYRPDARQHKRYHDEHRRHDERQGSGRFGARDDVIRKDRGGEDHRDIRDDYGSKRRRTRSPSPARPRRSRSPSSKPIPAAHRDIASSGSIGMNKQKVSTNEKAGDDRPRVAFHQGAGLSTSHSREDRRKTTEIAQDGIPKPEKGVRCDLYHPRTC